MIEFVYFDVGGVVVKDFSGTNKFNELWSELGVDPENKEAVKKLWDSCKRTRCVTFDIDDLLPRFKALGLNVSEDYSLLMGFVDRFEKNEAIWPVIDVIQENVRVGLLTDQYPRMFDNIRKAGILPSIDWDIIIDSSEVNMQKPDDEIFVFAEKEAGVDGEHILFVDNAQHNIDVAEKHGWQTFLYDPQQSEVSSKKLLEYFMSNRQLF